MDCREKKVSFSMLMTNEYVPLQKQESVHLKFMHDAMKWLCAFHQFLYNTSGAIRWQPLSFLILSGSSFHYSHFSKMVERCTIIYDMQLWVSSTSKLQPLWFNGSTFNLPIGNEDFILVFLPVNCLLPRYKDTDNQGNGVNWCYKNVLIKDAKSPSR